MPVYKISFALQKENGNKGNSVSKDYILLNQEDADKFITQFHQLQKQLDSTTIANSGKTKQIEELIASFRKQDLSETIQYLEVKTYHDLATDTLKIQSNLPV